MNLRSVAAMAAVAASIVVSLSTTNWAQEKESNISRDRYEARTKSELDRARAELGKVRAKLGNAMFVAGFDGSPPLEVQIREAATKIRDAKDDAERGAATSELAALLDKYFEEDMTARAKELEDVQQRVARLQNQLERRRAKKQEIVDLQMKVALNDADGLGFYSAPKGDVFTFGAPQRVHELRVAAPTTAAADAGWPVPVTITLPPGAPVPTDPPAPPFHAEPDKVPR